MRKIFATLLAAASLTLPAAGAQTSSELTQVFSAFDENSTRQINYEAYDYVLSQIVFDVGPSDRRAARQVEAPTGSLINRQNTSRYRLEGNRVIFHLMTDEHKDYIQRYRQELEALPGVVDLSSLNRNEQLAYWLNLHNIVMLDEIAKAYPVNEPLDDIRIERVDLVDAPIVALPDRTLSLNQIKDIVVANWADPRVMYGFYTYTVGGPSIQKQAFSGALVWYQLDRIGSEFVNALRGIDLYDNPVRISRLFYEYDALFPNGDEDLRRHFLRYGEDEVLALLSTGNRFAQARFDNMIADLTDGTRCGFVNASPVRIETGSDRDFNGSCPAVPPTTEAFIVEVQERRLRLFRDGRLGRVTIRDVETEPLPDPDSR